MRETCSRKFCKNQRVVDFAWQQVKVSTAVGDIIKVSHEVGFCKEHLELAQEYAEDAKGHLVYTSCLERGYLHPEDGFHCLDVEGNYRGERLDTLTDTIDYHNKNYVEY